MGPAGWDLLRRPWFGYRLHLMSRIQPRVRPSRLHRPLTAATQEVLRPAQARLPAAGRESGQADAYSFAQKLRYEPDGGLRILLHDPVPGPGDNAARNVRGDEAQILGHAEAKGFLCTQCQYGHRQLACTCQECFVVERVLGKRPKLFKGIMYGMRACIELLVVLASSLVNLLRIGRKLVVEPIEINPLAPGNQALLVRPAKVEVPQQWAANDIVPVAYAGKRSVDRNPAANARGVLNRQGIADHVSDVVGDEIGLLHLKGIHYPDNVDGLIH